MQRRSTRKLFAAWAVAAAALTGAPIAGAADAHSHGAHAPAPKAPAGTRWQTDAALREGMDKIRHHVEPQLGPIHSGRYSAAQYAALGRAIETQIAYIVGNCKLDPDADAALHGVLAGLSDGIAAFDGKASAAERGKGVEHIVEALNRYGQDFDHPGWAPLNAAH